MTGYGRYGGGGGAGGSVYIEVLGTAGVTGSGQIEAKGGHGAVSNSTLFNGGACSGCKVHLVSFVNTFTGTFDARGGLSLLPLPYFTGSGVSKSSSSLSYFADELHNTTLNTIDGGPTTFRKNIFGVSENLRRESSLILTAGAAGSIVISNTNQSTDTSTTTLSSKTYIALLL